MATSRFFVTNLPENTTENDLREIFEKYGPISLIELKSKENVLEPNSVNVFAFVTLQISGDHAQDCLHELKWQKLHGAKIKVALAKESFLERLKRERIENETGENDITKTTEVNDVHKQYIPENLQNTRRVFNIDQDIDDDEIEPDLLITKKRAGRSMQNGKIVIEESEAAPLHIIQKEKKIKSDKKATASEQKRKESLKKMKNEYDQKKNAIQEALSSIQNGNASKIIKFSDAEDSNEDNGNAKDKLKTNIFGSDDETIDENISTLKVQYGEKGEKLAKLQSEHQSLDSRFRLDAKFVDGDNDENNENGKETEEPDDERKWQLNILEQVVGHKLDTDTKAQKAAKNKKMMRFDPSKAEHERLLRTTDMKSTTQKSNEHENVSTEVEKDNTDIAPVSKEVFYVVSNSLTEALKTRGEGFSLLNMFGKQTAIAELDQRADQLNQLKDERILVNKLNKNVGIVNYESSSSGEEESEHENDNNTKLNETTKSKVRQHKTSKQTKVILAETFFFTSNDLRLKEGATFFHYDKTKQIPEEDYEPVRQRLNKLIKKKINKTKKNLVNSGRKVKRNKKKI